jgi:nitrite reductase (NO-forming)
MATARNVAGCLAHRVALAGVLVLIACGCTATPPASIPSTPPPVTVTLEESQFVPPGGGAADGVPALTIPVGTTVTWTNNDPIDHTATEYLNGFAKPDARFDLELAPEESGSYTFTEAGTYEVGCVPHPAMQMLVIVE